MARRVRIEKASSLTPDPAPVAEQPGEVPGGHRRREVSPTRRRVKRTIYLVFLLGVFNYLVLPQLGQARNAADLISTVNPALLLLALGLEVTALVCYAKLLLVTLPPQPRLSLFAVFRIQLSTKTLNNTTPAGNVTGAVVGRQLLVEAGANPTSATFGLAVVSIGSAVVLNALLWIALFVSIPLAGFNPLYVTAALFGLIVVGAFASLVVLLMRGQEAADRIIRRLVRRIPFVDENAVSRVFHQVASQLRDLIKAPDLMRRGLLWASANWLLDAASLWVFLRAFGATMNPISLLVAFGLANVLAAIPITPGGLGVVEGILIPTLVGFGLDRSTASIGVLSYRLAAFWLPIPTGALAYASLKVGPLSLPKLRKLHPFRELAEEALEGADKNVWDEPVTETGGSAAPGTSTGTE